MLFFSLVLYMYCDFFMLTKWYANGKNENEKYLYMSLLISPTLGKLSHKNKEVDDKKYTRIYIKWMHCKVWVWLCMLSYA